MDRQKAEKFIEIQQIENPHLKHSEWLKYLYGTDNPEDPRVIRHGIIGRMLAARNEEEISLAAQEAAEWLREHPEDEYIIGLNARPMAERKALIEGYGPLPEPLQAADEYRQDLASRISRAGSVSEVETLEEEAHQWSRQNPGYAGILGPTMKAATLRKRILGSGRGE